MVADIVDRRCEELHLHLDKTGITWLNKCNLMENYVDALERIRWARVVHTTQPHFLSFEYGKRLFVHVGGEKHEITLYKCVGTEREIRPGHNLEKMLLNGEFDWFES